MPATDKGNCQATTIIIGRLIVHTVAVPPALLSINPTAYGVRLGVFPIHPVACSDLDWRFIPFLDRSGVKTLADEFYFSAHSGFKDPTPGPTRSA